MSNFEHINLPENCKETFAYSSPKGGGGNKAYPERNRRVHAETLLSQFAEAYRSFAEATAEQEVNANGVYLDIEGQADSGLKYDSLTSNSGKKKITQQTVTTISDGEHEIVRSTIFVSNDAKDKLTDKIEAYRDTEDPRSGKPKNDSLVRSIERINLSCGMSLWKGRSTEYPTEQHCFCELWIALEEEHDAEEIKKQFLATLDNLHIQHSNNTLTFSQRIVFLANICDSDIADLMQESGLLCEIRSADVPAHFFIEKIDRAEQAEWINELIDRIHVEPSPSVAVSLLDEGVTSGHPLMSPVIKQYQCDTLYGDGNTTDLNLSGHGTAMAGTVVYKDLAEVLASTQPCHIPFGLLSVKILPDAGANDPKLYGALTQQAVSRSEIMMPQGEKVYCLATTAERKNNGTPSSWSSALDAICCGTDDEDGEQRLVVVSAGNQEEYFNRTDYPEYIKESTIHNPAHAYNVLTVGAYTEKLGLTSQDPQLNGANRSAPKGGISPFSSSSIKCNPDTPLKPEVVFEGGNTFLSIGCNCKHDDLSLLTCESDFQRYGYFTTNQATSCATALAANFAARLQLRYPDYWPETIRALMVHSARWTDEMIRLFPATKKGEMTERIRVCGYGVPQENIAFNSHENVLTYVSQAEIQPFVREGNNDPKFNEMHLYDLPWPKDVLLDLGAKSVTMRITLSYFIEPNPGEGGGRDKYTYASCGLRFEVSDENETKEDFKKRVNKAMREDGERIQSSHDSDRWEVGATSRSLGSIHSDFMTTTAANLAGCSYIAIRPVTGWWKFHKKDRSYEKRIRYSLVVSLEVDDEAIDLYTPVAQKISQMVQTNVAVTN